MLNEKNALSILVSTLSKRYDIKIKFHSENSVYTDGATIYLPIMKQKLTSDRFYLIHGFVTHESGHIRFTDFDRSKQITEKIILKKTILNIIEDARVDKLMKRLYSGYEISHAVIERDYQVKGYVENRHEFIDTMIGVGGTISTYLHLCTINNGGKYEQLVPIIGSLKNSLDKIDSSLSSSMRDIAENTLSTLETFTDSENALSLIWDIIVPFLSSEEKEKNNSLDDYTDNDGNNDDGETDNFVKNKSNDKKGAKYSSDELSISEAIATELAKNEKNGLLASDNKKDVFIGEEDIEISRDRYMDEIEDTKEVDSVVRTMIAKLHNKIQTVSLSGRRISTRGRLSCSHLHRVASNNSHIFTQREIKPQLDVSVNILLDASGSMCRSIELANKVCYALAKCMSEIKNVDVSVSTFNSIKINDVLDLNEQIHNKFDNKASGSTPMCAALLHSIEILYWSRRNKKIIILITDGMPDDLHSTTNLLDTIQKDYGVTVFGIGIGQDCDYIKKIIPSSYVLNNIHELSATVFDSIAPQIVDNGLTN